MERNVIRILAIIVLAAFIFSVGYYTGYQKCLWDMSHDPKIVVKKTHSIVTFNNDSCHDCLCDVVVYANHSNKTISSEWIGRSFVAPTIKGCIRYAD